MSIPISIRSSPTTVDLVSCKEAFSSHLWSYHSFSYACVRIWISNTFSDDCHVSRLNTMLRWFHAACLAVLDACKTPVENGNTTHQINGTTLAKDLFCLPTCRCATLADIKLETNWKWRSKNVAQLNTMLASHGPEQGPKPLFTFSQIMDREKRNLES